MNNPDSQRVFNILLVEDNPGDVRLIMEALKEQAIGHYLQVAADGVEAVNILHAATDESLPDLIFLDWNLPRKNGREVLADIKEDPRLKHIPVVVLTTSETMRDIRRAYELHANCYITKPLDLDAFMAVIKAIELFWLTIVKLPRKPK